MVCLWFQDSACKPRHHDSDYQPVSCLRSIVTRCLWPEARNMRFLASWPSHQWVYHFGSHIGVPTKGHHWWIGFGYQKESCHASRAEEPINVDHHGAAMTPLRQHDFKRLHSMVVAKLLLWVQPFRACVGPLLAIGFAPTIHHQKVVAISMTHRGHKLTMLFQGSTK